jgi:uncharacterized RDD family membrane protein YckC
MEFCGFWKRVLAFIIDGMILFFISVVFPPIGLLSLIIYYPVFHSSRLQATPGKAILGLKVTSSTGETLTYKMAFLRELAKFITAATIGIGYLMILFTKRKQTLHDYLLDAVVVTAEDKDENYFYAWWDQVKYLFSKKEEKIA